MLNFVILFIEYPNILHRDQAEGGAHYVEVEVHCNIESGVEALA